MPPFGYGVPKKREKAVDKLVRVIGVKATRTLVEALGGQKLKIPKKFSTAKERYLVNYNYYESMPRRLAVYELGVTHGYLKQLRREAKQSIAQAPLERFSN